jgi:hypothetical protein
VTGDTIKQRYTQKQRKITTVTKTKQVNTKDLYDPENGFMEKVKVYSKSFQIQYKNKEKEGENNGCSEQDQENECCDKTDINLSIVADIFHNIMNIRFVMGSSTLDSVCVNRNVSNLFKCPVITYNRPNGEIYMCDSVTSSCTHCNSGKVS